MQDSTVSRIGSRSMDVVHLQQRPKLKCKLTRREREIIYYICLGNTIGEVSSIMFLAQSTVISHKRNIFLKLDIHSLVSLGVLAERYGLTQKPHFHE